MPSPKAFLALAALTFVPVVHAQVSVDGTIGAEWAGVTPKAVLYNPAAQTGNFGTPTNENNAVAYSIYFRSDSSYLYIGLQSAAPGMGNGAWSSGVNFANLYLDMDPLTFSGSDIGFTFGGPGGPASQVFVPGGVNGTGSVLGSLSAFIDGTASTGASAEMAIPWSYLEGGYAANGIPTRPLVDHNNDALNTIRINLSQSYGYSVAGGAGSYGYERLGVVPEPGTWLAGGMASLAMGTVVVQRRRRAKA